MSNARYGLRVRSGLVRGITEGLAAIDADALAFLNAAGITNATQYSAIVQLVADLKNYGLWTKMKAIYPFVGGTASTHKFNLKDPRDLDAAFRLIFNGGITHNSNGVTFNGVNGYADARLSPLNDLQQNKNSQTIYSRILPNQNAYNGTNNFSLGSFINGSTISAVSNGAETQIAQLFLGFISYVRRSSGQSDSIQTYKNGFSLGTNNFTSTTPTSNNYWIGAVNNNNSILLPSPYNIAFYSLGDDLNNTEAANFYTAVQAFQTTLARQI